MSTSCSLSADARRSELRCDRYAAPRTREICETIAAELGWELMGHAIVAPGYKVTQGTVLRSFCKLKLTPSDASALRPLTNGEDRLRSAASSLLAVLGADPKVGETSVMNPHHPEFLLKQGCPTAP